MLWGIAAAAGCGGPMVTVGADDGGGTSADEAGPGGTVFSGSAGSGGGTSVTTGATATSATTDPTGPDATSTDYTTDGPAYGIADAGWPDECSVWSQDCPDGEKCLPYAADDADTWNATHCVPVAADPKQRGEPCTVEGDAVSGVDDCELGLMCFYVDEDTLTGTCVQQCEGNEANPVCDDPNTLCTIANGGTLVVCLPTCHPLADACEDGSGCYAEGLGFVCAPVPGDAGGYGAECEPLDGCQPGLQCVSGDYFPGCASPGCCTVYCDVTDDNADLGCPRYAEGEHCLAWFVEGAAPPEYADVGVCVIPPD